MVYSYVYSSWDALCPPSLPLLSDSLMIVILNGRIKGGQPNSHVSCFVLGPLSKNDNHTIARFHFEYFYFCRVELRV